VETLTLTAEEIFVVDKNEAWVAEHGNNAKAKKIWVMTYTQDDDCGGTSRPHANCGVSINFVEPTSECGPRAKSNYSRATENWPDGSTWCTSPSVLVQGSFDPNQQFPSPGKTTSWKCKRPDAPEISCSATRQVRLTYNIRNQGQNPGYLKRDGEDEQQQTISMSRVPGEKGRKIHAVPSQGMLFEKWSDNSTDNPREDQATSSGDKTFTAIFVAEVIPPECGDNNCEAPDENATNCPEDCTVCGDEVCTGEETNESCPGDCPPVCGDEYCHPEAENASNCSDDCPTSCGDGFCTGNETNESCPVDCPPLCGDEYCDPQTENAANCSQDCPTVCEDGFCTGDETQESCPQDCGYPTTLAASGGTTQTTGGGTTQVVTVQKEDGTIVYQTVTKVPEAGIFDDVEKPVLVGVTLVFLGLTWSWIGRGMYLTVNFLGKIHRRVAIGIKDVKENVRMRRRTNQMKKDSQRKKKFEKKVGKRI
jgi:hypothetical protein